MTSTSDNSETLPVLEYGQTTVMPQWLRLTIVGALILFAIAMTVHGFRYRRSLFESTKPIRYVNDVSNGYGWGQISARQGLFQIYDLKAANRIRNYPNDLDYTPLRLTVVTLWARYVNAYYPDARGWRNDFDFTKPMLMANATAELLSSILVFLLVRMWIVRMDEVTRSPLTPRRPFRGVTRGMIAALLFWFNPAILWNGHGFPQWDVWNAPFFLGAVLLGCLDWWFAAGCCVVIGAFLKGQILLVSPIFLIWPLVQLRWDAILRFAAGFVLAGAVLAFPWMRPNSREMVWVMLVLTALALTTPIVLRWRIDYHILIGLGVIALILVWPWKTIGSFNWHPLPQFAASDDSNIQMLDRLWGILVWCWQMLSWFWDMIKAVAISPVAPLIIVGIVIVARFLPSRLAPAIYALAVGLLVLLLIPLYGASSSWYRIGFQYGTEKLMWMATRDTYNLPYILTQYFRWPDDPEMRVNVPILGKMMFRTAMLLAYGACLVMCGIAAAVHEKRNDSRFLLAMVTPWLCWFVLITQLNNRYMVWASGFSALLVGVGMGMTLLGIIVSIIGWAGIAVIMCWSGGDPALARNLRPLTPHLAWPLFLAAAIYLWVAISFSPWKVFHQQIVQRFWKREL